VGILARQDIELRASMQIYEVRPLKDKRGVDLLSDALPFGGSWYEVPDAASNAVKYAKFFSWSHPAVIRVYDAAGNVIETHENKGEFKEVVAWLTSYGTVGCHCHLRL
jgi:hypothetical protein